MIKLINVLNYLSPKYIEINKLLLHEKSFMLIFYLRLQVALLLIRLRSHEIFHSEIFNNV